MNENPVNSEATDSDIYPISMENRTLSGISMFVIWFTCNLVVTTVLTGMSIIPEISMGSAIFIFLIGSAVGIIPLVLIGIIGSKTGLTTMGASRGAFGIKGSIIPSTINVVILIAWSWAQAGLGGYALNYLSKTLFGFDNPTLFIILLEVAVIFVALYAIKGIALYEKLAMVLIIVVMGITIFKGFATFGFTEIMQVPVKNVSGLTKIAAFDLIVSMALSWVPLSADYSRNCKSVKGGIIGSALGYTLGTTIAMSVGAVMVGMLIVGNMEVVYEPSEAFGQIGLGIPGAVAIFMSVIAANVMCIYSSTMSFINMMPRFGFKKTALAIGLVCILGAVFSGILDAFLGFIGIVGIVFMPLFAIMIADFFVIQKQEYDVEAIVYPERKDTYHYTKGFNITALAVYVISAAIAYYLTIINPISIGATIPSFFIAFLLYIVVAKIVAKNKK